MQSQLGVHGVFEYPTTTKSFQVKKKKSHSEINQNQFIHLNKLLYNWNHDFKPGETPHWILYFYFQIYLHTLTNHSLA